MMLLNPLQTVLPLLSELARFREEPGGLSVELKGLDIEWKGQRIRFLGGQLRLSELAPGAPSAPVPAPVQPPAALRAPSRSVESQVFA